MVFLGVRYPTPASRRVATEYGASRGHNYPPEHVGATRACPPPPSPAPTPGPPPSSSPPSSSASPRPPSLRLPSVPYAVDRTFARVGSGEADFRRAKRLLREWGHFQLGWSEVDPATPVAEDARVCVCANVLGVWIRNPLRVVYLEDGIRPGGGERVLSDRFAFAHGCLDGHLLAGEEAFVLERRAEDDSVWYGVCAFSKPAHPLAAAGYPAVRFLQWKFGRDSCAAVKQGVARARGEEAREAKR